MAETVEQAKARYDAAAHAMQSGVAMMMNYDEGETEPKHLRVGVNSSLVNSSALALLLISKGVIDEAEFFAALADAMESERDDYAKLIGDHLAQLRPEGSDGPEVNLH